MAACWLAELNLELEAERSQIHGLIACQPGLRRMLFLVAPDLSERAAGLLVDGG
jgi:hypothetical protein